MNTNAVLSLGPQLAEAFLVLDALISNGETEFLIAQARKRCRVLAADLKAAKAEPQGFLPWSYGNQRNACPDFKPGGGHV